MGVRHTDQPDFLVHRAYLYHRILFQWMGDRSFLVAFHGGNILSGVAVHFFHFTTGPDYFFIFGGPLFPHFEIGAGTFSVGEMGSLAGDAIMWGCIFALWQAEILRILNRALSRCRPLIFLPFLMIFLLKAADHIHTDNLVFRIFHSFLGTTVGAVADICIGLIILISIQCTHNFWFAFLNFKWISQIGILSYSLYLWQEIFFSPKLGMLSLFPLNILCIFIAACLSYGLIEGPFLRLKSRYEPDRQPRPTSEECESVPSGACR